MKKIFLMIITVLVTFLITATIAINTVKVTNVENGNITIKIFNQYINYYFEKEF